MKNIIHNEYSKTEEGLKDLLRVARRYSDTYSPKLEDMEITYLKVNPHLYDDMEKQRLKYYREAFSYKLYLATMHLEQIWALSHVGKSDYSLRRILENIFDRHQTKEDGALLLSFAFEGFIVQGNAFLDFYLLYICHIFKIHETNYMSSGKFLKALSEVTEEPFAGRAKAIDKYFRENVFGLCNWGELLKKLRNSILHRDMLAPSFENQITLLQQIIGDCHDELKDTSCSRYCQDADNSMFDLVTTAAALIYDVEWKAGSHKPSS